MVDRASPVDRLHEYASKEFAALYEARKCAVGAGQLLRHILNGVANNDPSGMGFLVGKFLQTRGLESRLRQSLINAEFLIEPVAVPFEVMGLVEECREGHWSLLPSLSAVSRSRSAHHAALDVSITLNAYFYGKAKTRFKPDELALLNADQGYPWHLSLACRLTSSMWSDICSDLRDIVSFDSRQLVWAIGAESRRAVDRVHRLVLEIVAGDAHRSATLCEASSPEVASGLSKPMTKKDLARHHAGRRVSNPTDYLGKLVKKGLLTAPTGSGKWWKVRVAEFPEAVRDKLR